MKRLKYFIIVLSLFFTPKIYSQLFSIQAELNLTPDITFLGDIDSDGVLEFMVYTSTSESEITIFETKNLTSKYQLKRPTMQGTSGWGIGVPINLEQQLIKLIDLNSNGIKDLFFQKFTDNKYYFGFLDPATNFTLFEYETNSDVRKFYMGDFDGDENVDLLVKTSKKLLLFKSSIPVTVTNNNIVKDLPINYRLEQNFPNPFNNSTTIQYMIGQPERVVFNFYNIKGELVSTIEREHNMAGNYSLHWDGQNNKGYLLSSGVYFYQMITNKMVSAKKMILLK